MNNLKKITRCKNCIYDGAPECPLAYIERQTLCFVEHSPTFFCAKGTASEDYIPTRADDIRNMTDRQLAEFINRQQKIAVNEVEDGGEWSSGRAAVEWLTGYLGTPEGEDY